MSAPDPTRRALFGVAALGLAGTVLSRVARADDPPPAGPTVPEDASKVLGAPSTPRSERSPFADDATLAPSGVLTGPSYSPIHKFYGTITPTDLQFQRHHAGIAYVDPEKYRLMLHGLVDRPLMLTLDEIKRFPPTTRVAFLECSGNGRAAYRAATPELTPQKIDGLVANLEWTGVKLSTVLREVGVKPDATWIYAEGGDAAKLTRSVPIEKALDDAMLVYAANGEPLRAAHGYPLRLLLPGWEANMNIKWLRRLELAASPGMFRDETSKYAEPIGDGTARYFSWVLDAKSVITAPAHPDVLTGPGWWPISGIAWSGRGKIARVDVSTDGGQTWTAATLDGTPQDKAMVRFSHPWRWTGEAAVLMSRATDDTGYVQPTWEQFQQVRGPGTDYHFNAIRAWRVDRDGRVFFRPDGVTP
jgi:sulfane dehydrogenase subunit SoxC